MVKRKGSKITYSKLANHQDYPLTKFKDQIQFSCHWLCCPQIYADTIPFSKQQTFCSVSQIKYIANNLFYYIWNNIQNKETKIVTNKKKK